MLAVSAAAGVVAAAVAVVASRDFFGSLDLERELLGTAAAATMVGLAKVALADDHGWDPRYLQNKQLTVLLNVLLVAFARGELIFEFFCFLGCLLNCRNPAFALLYGGSFKAVLMSANSERELECFLGDGGGLSLIIMLLTIQSYKLTVSLTKLMMPAGTALSSALFA